MVRRAILRFFLGGGVFRNLVTGSSRRLILSRIVGVGTVPSTHHLRGRG